MYKIFAKMQTFVGMCYAQHGLILDYLGLINFACLNDTKGTNCIPKDILSLQN